MAKDKVIVIRGILDWAKVLGPARPHTGEKRYDKGPYWSVEITPDAKSMKMLEQLGLTKGGQKGTGKLRTPSEKDTKRVGKGLFLPLKVLENKMVNGQPSGEKNKPPRLVDIANKEWTGGDLGNGTVADVMIKVVDYGSSVEKGVYLQGIMVLDHVPYVSNGFAPLSEDDEYFGKSPSQGINAEPESFDDEDMDDVPF